MKMMNIIAICATLFVNGCIATTNMWSHATEKQMLFSEFIGFGCENEVGPGCRFAVVSYRDRAYGSFYREIYYYKFLLGDVNSPLYFISDKSSLEELVKKIYSSDFRREILDKYQLGKKNLVEKKYALEDSSLNREYTYHAYLEEFGIIGKIAVKNGIDIDTDIRVILIEDPKTVGAFLECGPSPIYTSLPSPIILIVLPKIQQRIESERTASVAGATLATPFVFIADVFVTPFVYIRQIIAAGVSE